MFVETLFVITKIGKQPKCPWRDEWIKTMCNMYTMKYSSAIKKNEILPFVTTLIDLEGIMLGEINRRKTNKHYLISLTCGI